MDSVVGLLDKVVARASGSYGRAGSHIAFFLPSFLVAETRTRSWEEHSSHPGIYEHRALGLHICAVRNTSDLNGTHLDYFDAPRCSFREDRCQVPSIIFMN